MSIEDRPKKTAGAMTVAEIATIMNVDDATVRRWIAKRELPAYELPGSGKQSIYRVLRPDWARFMESRRRG